MHATTQERFVDANGLPTAYGFVCGHIHRTVAADDRRWLTIHQPSPGNRFFEVVGWDCSLGETFRRTFTSLAAAKRVYLNHRPKYT